MSINYFAKTNFRNQERVFGIKEDDRRRHMYVIGKTGMGKSNLLENMAIQDIQNGEGVCVVDPHGEFAEKMLRAIPSDRINDVIYFNPADSEFPIAFNILEAVDEDKKNLVASGMMGVFKKIWPDVWSPRMEYILNNTILALLDYPGSTMLGVNRMMFDKDYRKRVYPKIKDPVVKSFWINEFDKWEDKFRKEAVAAIQNKVGQFLSSTVIRHIVGQPKSTIDMRDIMDNQKILIVNLSKGRIGEDAMRLLGGMIVTKIQLAAMGRVDMPEEERKDFYLYVDEFQNFATESFANILSEARKYKLCLILAHQYIKQLVFDSNTTVRDAIFGNVGTLVSFRVGAEDAEFLEKEFEPVFMMNDLVNLSKYNIYLKLMIDGVTGDAFSAASLSPADLSDTASSEEKVTRVSRERYGRSRAEVEEKIARWSGMLSLDEFEKLAKGNGGKEAASTDRRGEEGKNPMEQNVMRNNSFVNYPVVKNLIPKQEGRRQETKRSGEEKKDNNFIGNDNRPMFTTVCATCEETIQVPFNPDPTRPTFCKECLKDYQRARAKAQGEAMVNGEEKKGDWRKRKSFSKGISQKESNGYSNGLIPEKKENLVVSVPQDKSIRLNQLSHMSPKKFRPQKKININLKEVRDLLNKSRSSGQ